jgi:hypothetical protein
MGALGMSGKAKGKMAIKVFWDYDLGISQD